MRLNKALKAIILLGFNIITTAQIPSEVFEIESILVDGCAGSDEGRNEMIIFMCGPNGISIDDIRVDGAGSTGAITTNVWPNTSNPFRGWAAPGTMSVQVAISLWFDKTYIFIKRCAV
ncbi:MAG: hypothetical protein JXR53_12640 [Bacteroidales bacterium]|nr:hypothetical protein [Bacteroidales bacterium]